MPELLQNDQAQFSREQYRTLLEVAEAIAAYRDLGELFDDLASKQVNAALAGHSHFVEIRRHATSNLNYEKIVFSLKVGEISSLIDSPTQVLVLKCVERVPADATKKLDDVREVLEKEERAKKIEQEIPVLMNELKEKAHAKVLMEP